MKETELAAAVVSWLRSNGWHVWQEVRGIDIVATADHHRIWAIECKTALNFEVIAQAADRGYTVHWVSVAVPHKTNRKTSQQSRGHYLAREVLRERGVGLLFVDKGNVWVESEAKLCRRLGDRLILGYVKSLRAQLADTPQDFCAAGTSSPSPWSPFKSTVNELIAHVQQNPGTSIRDAVRAIEHHYRRDSTARACLTHWLSKGIIKGVRIDRSGKAWKLYPQEVM